MTYTSQTSPLVFVGDFEVDKRAAPARMFPDRWRNAREDGVDRMYRSLKPVRASGEVNQIHRSPSRAISSSAAKILNKLAIFTRQSRYVESGRGGQWS